jgi:medium-chain acyl-[acyl-carrier-protein] hydrolase
VTGAEVSSRTWLRCEPAVSTVAAVRLVCLPHAGGGAASFTRWLSLFPPGIAIVRVQLPGREDAVTEPPLRRARDAVAALLPRLNGLTGTPVALYGHSMGAVVAFELARALRAAGTPPVHLFVSGRRAPHLPAHRAPIHHLPDDAFIAALEAAFGPGGTGGAAGGRGRAFLRYSLPLIKADLELAEEHTYHRQPRLPCPITAFYGTEDPIVDVDEVEAWQEHTDATFTIRSFPGDHFFHQRHRSAIAANIVGALA